MNSQEPSLNKDEWRFYKCCDRCGVSALYVAFKDHMDLLFCGHHFTMSSEALLADGWDFENFEETIDADERVAV